MIVEADVSSTRENVHKGLPSVGNQAVFIFVMAVKRCMHMHSAKIEMSIPNRTHF